MLDATLCGSPSSKDGESYNVVPLATLCEMLDEASAAACPASRRARLEALSCATDQANHLLLHECDVDIMDQSDLHGAYRWLFDRESGALIGGSVSAQLRCGRAVYLTPDFPACPNGPSTRCEICESGPERDASCPADVLGVFPSRTCTVSPAASCACTNDAGVLRDVPASGSPCDPSCASECQQAGFCVPDCRCSSDGSYRWRVECGE